MATRIYVAMATKKYISVWQQYIYNYVYKLKSYLYGTILCKHVDTTQMFHFIKNSKK